MSSNDLAPARAPVRGWLTLPQAAGQLAAILAQEIASAVLRRAARQAHRQLAAFDDRMLADIGVVRAELTLLVTALAETRTAAVPVQFPWNPRLGA